MTALPNGLRVITDRVEDSHSVALGIWVNVGTRHETFGHNGAAHMVEHMLFKGTPGRSAQDISKTVESVGGHMNAYTAREATSYHIHLLKDDAKLALDILADMYQNAVLPEDELERERQVILQEIGMSLDTPDDLIFDNYYETAYPAQSLGIPILGRGDYIGGIQRGILTDYIHNFYTPERTVISAAGAINHAELVEMAQEAFVRLPVNKGMGYAAASYTGGAHYQKKDLEQSHFILGFQGVSRMDEDYHAAQIYAGLMGGGMSSRLFQEIREKRGLVYAIYAFHSGYIDSGQFAVYAGTGAEGLREVVPLICDEMMKTLDGVTEEEVRRAAAQIKSGILLGRESMMSRADQQAKALLYRNKVLNVEDLLEKIERIDAAAVQKVARRILSSVPTVAALGPLAHLEPYDAISGRFKI